MPPQSAAQQPAKSAARASRPAAARARRRLSPRRRLLFLAVSLLLVAAMAELTGRFWLWRDLGTPWGRPDAAILGYYPELRGPMMQPVGGDDGYFDVLVLAGSVLYDYYGAPGAHLKHALESRGYGPVRVWNMALPAHTSRDSLFKYRWLEGCRFDQVIVYHGINDLRANNVSQAEFRTDYSHIRWYSDIRWVAPGPRGWGLEVSALPPMAGLVKSRLKHWLRPAPSLQYNESPRAELREYGSQIKTVPSFRANIGEIVEIARRRGEPILLSTYAWHLPAGYSDAALEQDRERLRDGDFAIGAIESLPYASAVYADFSQPVAIWGDVEAVRAGLVAHNRVIGEVSGAQGVKLAPAARILTGAEQFIDICHLSNQGVQMLVDTWVAGMGQTADSGLEAVEESSVSE